MDAKTKKLRRLLPAPPKGLLKNETRAQAQNVVAKKQYVSVSEGARGNAKKVSFSSCDVDVTVEVSKHEQGSRSTLETDLERALFRWFERYQQQQQREKHGTGDEVKVTVLLSTIELRKRAHGIARRLGASQDFIDTITRVWIRRWQTRYGVPKTSGTSPPPTSGSSQSADITITVTPAAPQAATTSTSTTSPTHTTNVADDISILQTPAEQLRQILRNGEYTADQVYCAYGFQFDWKSLPDRNLEETAPKDKVWVLMAANRTGRHRTRMLITGKLWRPHCLRHVNMLSQPVVYAGGGSGTLTPDLFTWWFHREFAPAAMSLNPRGAVLVVEQASFVPQETECIAADGAVKLVIFPRGNFDDGAILDHGLIVSELRTQYAKMLLSSIAASNVDQQHATLVPDYLTNFVLKDAFPLLHRSWLNVRSETFIRCWEKVATLTNEEPMSFPPTSGYSLVLTSCASSPAQAQEDRMMLLELQWLSHDLGLEVTDDDLARWALQSGTSQDDPLVEDVKVEPVDEAGGETTATGVPTAAEAADHLAQALLWMETEPLDPGLLLVGIFSQVKYSSPAHYKNTTPGGKNGTVMELWIN
ncbi:hypothetical protein C0J52_21714 [Blattella germanica]|nr:hypothetical protein C0J52_21714 [Blattella germanica]